MVGSGWNTPSPNPLPQGGEGFFFLSPLPEGEGWVRASFCFTPPIGGGMNALNRFSVRPTILGRRAKIPVDKGADLKLFPRFTRVKTIL